MALPRTIHLKQELKGKQFLTVMEVAQTLRFSRSTIYRLIHRKARPLPTQRFGRTGDLRIPVNEFQRWHYFETKVAG